MAAAKPHDDPRCRCAACLAWARQHWIRELRVLHGLEEPEQTKKGA